MLPLQPILTAQSLDPFYHLPTEPGFSLKRDSSRSGAAPPPHLDLNGLSYSEGLYYRYNDTTAALFWLSSTPIALIYYKPQYSD